MSVLDELLVREGEAVELRIIPPDSLSSESDVLVICPWDSQPGVEIVRTDLPRIAEAVGADSAIVGITHIGDDTYTVRTIDGVFREVDGNTCLAFLRSIRRIAELVEAKAFGSQNHLPPREVGRCRQVIRRPMRNRMRQDYLTAARRVSGFLLVGSGTFRAKPKEKVDSNPFPSTSPRNRGRFRRPNRMGELSHAG